VEKDGKRKRRKFSTEYKAETVRLVQRSGKSIGQMALELGIGETALRRWVEQAEVELFADELDGLLAKRHLMTRGSDCLVPTAGSSQLTSYQHAARAVHTQDLSAPSRTGDPACNARRLSGNANMLNSSSFCDIRFRQPVLPCPTAEPVAMP
jgi:transposase-like protein